MKYDVFISYSRMDTAIADRICAAFDKVGITYFIDRQSIGGGFEFPVVLAEAIIESQVILFLGSKSSYESKFTNAELTFAFNEKPKNSILPYIIDGSTMPPALRFVFSSINWRTIESHPIETTLMSDILAMLGRKATTVKATVKTSTSKTPTAAEMNDKGVEAYNKGDYAEAVRCWIKAADHELMSAQSNLAFCYYNGQGVAKDYAEAARWYRKAADQGSAMAQNVLGNMYYNGEGVAKDLEESVKWYRKSADQGFAKGQFNLGFAYHRGKGVAQDCKEAIIWYRKAAEQGHVKAQCKLAYCHIEFGVIYDPKESLKWYRKAAEQNDAEAIYRIGEFHTGAHGALEKNLDEAIKCFRKSAGMGYDLAIKEMGWCYEKGIGVSQDYAEAARWYRKSSEQNYRWSQFRLGNMYENGLGVSKDMNEAIEWYKKSARLGYQEAIDLLKKRGISF